jgi:hypothetical protein
MLLVPILFVILTPVMLFQRYRTGTARRQARPWLISLNLAAMVFSAAFFLISAGITTIWFPFAFSGATLGISAGVILGGLGLLLTHWEETARSLHYTPNRWLVLLVTLVVTARVMYGFVRTFEVAQAGVSGTALAHAFGVPESLAAGGVVIGYYLAYNAGVRWRLNRNGRRSRGGRSFSS